MKWPSGGTCSAENGNQIAASTQIQDFRPNLVAVSVGFDAHAHDPIANETLEAEDFHWLGESLRKLGVPILSLLEGGCGDDLVEACGRLPKLCESAHIPVQSGSNRILKLMHRGYTRERFVRIIEKLRRVQPGIGLCTDFIVGFPGETEADFEETLSLVREVEFDQAYIFKYSPRKDTPAAKMPDQLPREVKEERNQRLLASVNDIAGRKYRACVGRTEQILVEGSSKKNPARMTGRTRSNKIVVFEGSERHRGQLMDVRITRAGSFTLYGDPAVANL